MKKISSRTLFAGHKHVYKILQMLVCPKTDHMTAEFYSICCRPIGILINFPFVSVRSAIGFHLIARRYASD
jgi:hypothetical protein